MWVRIPPGAAHFSLKIRQSEPSQLVVLCCLALFDASQLHNYVLIYMHIDTCSFVATCNIYLYVPITSMANAFIVHVPTLPVTPA